MRFSIIFAVFLMAGPVWASDFAYERRYEDGREFGYRLETRTFNNGAPDSVKVAVSRHKVIGGGIPVEEVRWLSLTEEKGGTVTDLSEAAQSVAPYRISLRPEGPLDLPPLTVPEMVGAIADLNTFYVSVSHALGVENLSGQGTSYTNPENLVGDWADGENIRLGKDCTRATLELTSLTPETATITTRYEAPEESCLAFPEEWMAAPVAGEAPNNFVQVRKLNGAWMVMWGREAFTVVSEVDRASGIIRSAAMENDLTLKLRIGCDEALANCQGEFPFAIRRELALELQE